ncbi:MAG: DUF4838 domain-containing protein [Ruminococcaceae bacterium]|nr:DUF4838 domain-containing protein [Oscillospiraceae bacterium]
MKPLISLILAALLTALAITSCDTGKTTDETTATATETVETAAVESPLSFDNITENGEATAKIVLSADADSLEALAAEELVYHIQKVSGASVEVVNEMAENTLSIVIGTPESIPELAELFPEDITWLTTLEEDGKSYGSDGFAIRMTDDTLYIFGATPRGAMNGVYDFIEENMGVMWVRANEENGLLYDAMPTITVTKKDYHEKSPFETRGWHLCGEGQNRESHSDPATETMMSRNKLNAKFAELNCNEHLWSFYESIGLSPFNLGHNLRYWVLTSPIYDPECTEYWNTDEFGKPYPYDTTDASKSAQINFWSELTLETVKASVLNYLANNDTKTISVGIEDNILCTNEPWSSEPFEYAEGQFVEPGDRAYISTVFFTFLNRIAEAVAEEYPDVTINTFAYWLVEEPPLCKLADNVDLVIAPILEDMSSPINDPENANNVPIYGIMEKWKEVDNDIIVYNYYGSSAALNRYERPIWYRMQEDFRYYTSVGFNGLMPEGVTDAMGSEMTWNINALTFWLYSKLAWNPEEDVDALIVEFCDKYYGSASGHMQEYYRLLTKGWEEGESENNLWNFKLDETYYFDTFVYYLDMEGDFIAVLNEAYEAADDTVKERIRPIKESYEAYFAIE